MALADQYRSKLSEITSYDDRIAELTARKEAQYERVKKQAAVLTKARAAAAREVEKQLAERLDQLRPSERKILTNRFFFDYK